MKFFKYILTLFVLVLIMVSCRKSEDLNVDISEPTSYDILISLGEEFVDVDSYSMSNTKDSPNSRKYYGINVYCKKNDGTDATYSCYAYGVFDDPQKMKITLLSGYKYKFECTSISEDKDLFTNTYTLGSPFIKGQSIEYKMSDVNKFISDNFSNLSGLKLGKTDYVNNTSKKIPRMDRYYGELEGFDPASSKEAIIKMYRTVFGLNFNVVSIPDGKLSWHVYFYKDFVFDSGSTTTKYNDSTIYTFYNVYSAWKGGSIQLNLYFNWERANGYLQSFEKAIDVSRNSMKEIKINLLGGTQGNTIGCVEVEEEMQKEVIEISYDGGSI